MKLSPPQTAATHNRETFSLSEGRNICPCHPAKDGNPSPACVITPAQRTQRGEAARRQCLPFESICLRACLQPSSARHRCRALATSL